MITEQMIQHSLELAKKEFLSVRNTVQTSQSRLVPAMHTETFVLNDLMPRERTWINGAEDFFITRVVLRESESVDDKIGGGPDYINVVFRPYEWNIEDRRTGRRYGVPANETQFLSLQTSYRLRHGKGLGFSRPWLVRAGDALTLRVRATSIPITDGVRMTLVGFRTGAMAS